MEPQSTYEYDAFISYRRSDGTRAAQRLRKLLKSYRLPKSLREGRARRLAIFLDTVYERGASDFYEKTIRPALMASRHLVVVATPDAVQRPEGEDWIAREVADFSNGPRAGNVIVVRAIGDLDDVMPADIGVRYPHVQIVDMRDDGWIARLLPQRASRIADERLKIVAPLFDIPLELMPALRREEERQQIGRFGALAGAAAAVAITVVGLSLYALASQWRGQQALRDSFSITEDTIVGIVIQSSSADGIPYPSRELILQNCDVAGRLASATDVKPKPATSAACQIEEAFVIAFAGDTGDRTKGAEKVAAILDSTEAAIPAEGILDTGLVSVLRAGYGSWMALRRTLPDVELRTGAEKLAALERRLAARMTSYSFEAEAYRRAFDAVLVAAGELEQKSMTAEAARAYAAARKDAAAAIEAVLRTGRDALPAEQVGPIWTELAWMYYTAASSQAAILSKTADAAEGRSAMTDAANVYRRAPASADRAAVHAAIAHLNRFWGAWEMHQDDGAPKEPLWDCLSAAKASEEADAAGDHADRAREARDSCVELLSELIYAAARDAAAKPDLKEASIALREAADGALKIAGYQPPLDAWGQLLPMVILSDLAASYEAEGRSDDAEAARIEAAALFKPFNGSMDTAKITAARVEAIEGAWQRIWDGHNARIDGYRNAAAKSENAEAVGLLRKLLAEDDAWDALMAGVDDWDHVYQADVRLQLAGLMSAAGDHAGAQDETAKAYSRLERFGGKFDLKEGWLARANVVWAQLSAWKGAAPVTDVIEAQQPSVPAQQ
ncbi:hypothetical protein [Mesorhizobium sp. KR9-304]|uniref:hypothetical protein n=1 Tax=Mesorhizobium sp. KR9-304 TaxID=3156614 RepID=UPI0032B5D0E6